jgi:uncharacterized protein
MAQIPLPRPYQDTAPYWEAAKAHRLVLQQCTDCGEHQFYPRGVCSHCLSSSVQWRDASGRGTVYSFTVNHRAPHPGYRDQVPFVLAIIELAEGPRMMSHVVDCDPESVTIGMAVTVTFDDVTAEITLPKFRPA